MAFISRNHARKTFGKQRCSVLDSAIWDVSTDAMVWPPGLANQLVEGATFLHKAQEAVRADVLFWEDR
jgi:hypothetical protein